MLRKESLKSYIEELVQEVEKELEEANVTGNVDGYQTPHAFSRKSDKERRKKNATQLGYSLVDNDVDNITEAASKEAMGIAGFTGTRGDAVQNFIDTHKINAGKLFNFVKKGKLSDRMDLVTAIAGKPGNPIQKKMIKMFGESVTEGKKVFSVNPGIGKVKYSISSHDGVKKHKDGSDFFDIETFKNKVDLEKAIKNYTSQGFKMESVNEDTKKRFDVDFYKGDGDRQTSHEEIIRGDKFSDVVSQATKVAKSKGMNYVELYYKDAFIGSIDKKSNYTFKKGRNSEKSPLSVNENRWLELKNDESMHANKKLATGLKELKYQLAEVEKFFTWYNKIKNINELDSDNYWKRTNTHIYKIKERLINIARTLQEIEK